MSNLYRGPSYQDSDHLAERLKCEKLTDEGQRTTDDGRQMTDAKCWQKLTLPLCKVSSKGCTQLAAARDQAYQLLAQGRWFSPGTSASSTTNTGRHDTAEILLKVALSTNKFWSVM
jgi:hypothetical protein